MWLYSKNQLIYFRLLTSKHNYFKTVGLIQLIFKSVIIIQIHDLLSKTYLSVKLSSCISCAIELYFKLNNVDNILLCTPNIKSYIFFLPF